MACCTISPPTTSQKRGLEFDLPTSKRRKCGTKTTPENKNNSTLLSEQPIIDSNAKKLIFNSEDILLERIRNEAKRFIKRKQLAITKPTVTSSTTITAQKDIPLFSIEQVSQIVEKMMKEREEALQEEYELKLSEKLSEQYSTFVKFTHEQIQKRFETSNFSYVS
jgi:hypothetical protein